MLIFLDKNSKLKNADDVDAVTSAEIPDINNPVLFNMVKQHMIHGPRVIQNPTFPCMDPKKKKNHCTKYFPKDCNDGTKYTIFNYPIYRRRKDGKRIIFGSNRIADNLYVVPYNSLLLLRYNAHINLEVCSTVACIKYLLKYCYKGHDCAIMEIQSKDTTTTDNDELKDCTHIDYDEIRQYMYKVCMCTRSFLQAI